MTEAKTPRSRNVPAIIDKNNASRQASRPDLIWRGIFLRSLAETSNVTASALAAKISTSQAYHVRREDPEFRAKWQDALLEGYEFLEIETLARLRFGTGSEDNKFDIANALRLLASHKETVACERSLRSHEDEESILASLDRKIDAMRIREAEVASFLTANQPDQGANEED